MEKKNKKYKKQVWETEGESFSGFPRAIFVCCTIASRSLGSEIISGSEIL
jgi:hypothetical protein